MCVFIKYSTNALDAVLLVYKINGADSLFLSRFLKYETAIAGFGIQPR